MIIEQVKKELMKRNQEYMDKYENYNFWEQHIKFVVYEALSLAEELGADKEIVELGALLHDIALVSKVGTKVDHHTNGAKIAEDILNYYNYPAEKTKRVVNCVLHHRSCKNAENIEEVCVCDADILAHFDNIPMIFECTYKFHKIETIPEANKIIIDGFKKDFNDLSDRTKKVFKSKYDNIMEVLFPSLNI